MYYGKAEAGVGIACQNLTRQDVEEELTGMYSQRVLAGNTHPSAPHLFELRGLEQKLIERLVSIHLWEYAWVTAQTALSTGSPSHLLSPCKLPTLRLHTSSLI